ncbi:MAG: lipid II flippase MurJ, partial [Microgenomates group bacterium]
MFSWNSISLPKFLSGNAKWLDKQQTSIMSAAVVITVANVLSSLAGLIRERLLISSFFDTVLSQQSYEAFLVAFQIPDMMFQLLILGAVSAAFIPVFTKVRKGVGEDVAFAMTSTVMTILLLAFLVVGAVVAVFAEPLTAIRTGAAFTPHQIKVAADLTRIMILAQFFFAISNFFTGVLQSYHRFIIPAIAPVFYNIGIVAGVYLLSPFFGIYSAGIGVVIGALIHMALQLPAVYRLGFRFKPSLKISYPGVKRIFSLMPPRVLTYSLTELQSLS